MRRISRTLFSFKASALLAVALIAITLPGQAKPANAAKAAPAAAPAQDTAETQQQLLKLLRTSPTLTTVVARDPSLLADQAYVTRNNPELEQFLVAHPEVAQNPDYYLFSELNPRSGPRDRALERAVWPDLVPERHDRQSLMEQLGFPPGPPLFMLAVLFACVWAIRLLVESRRRKQQNEVHSRLIEKFSSNQELAAYMETDAGKRFLGAGSTGGELSSPMPNVVARILTSLQIGIVLALLGAGLLMLPRQGREMTGVVLGMLALMPGIGFILSAVTTFVLAKRLRLLPERPDANLAAQDRQ